MGSQVLMESCLISTGVPDRLDSWQHGALQPEPHCCLRRVLQCGPEYTRPVVKVKDPQASPCLLLDSIYKLMLFCGRPLLLKRSETVD